MRCRNCAIRDDDGRIVEMGHHDTVEEARACVGVRAHKEIVKTQTYVKNGIREAGLTSDDFTLAGLKKVAGILNLDSSGSKREIAARIREVL